MKKWSRLEFDRVMLPHLDRAYKLASWLLRHQHDAEDAVQQSYLKAFRGFDQYSDGDSGAWILKIVRNTCINRLNQRRRSANIISLNMVNDVNHDSDRHESAITPQALQKSPEQSVLDQQTKKAVWECIDALAFEFREVIILREFLGLNYEEIAKTTDIPIGTVMSRLSRARKQLRQHLASFDKEYKHHEL